MRDREHTQTSFTTATYSSMSVKQDRLFPSEDRSYTHDVAR